MANKNANFANREVADLMLLVPLQFPRNKKIQGRDQFSPGFVCRCKNIKHRNI